jgi:hypothetical protein
LRLHLVSSGARASCVRLGLHYNFDGDDYHENDLLSTLTERSEIKTPVTAGLIARRYEKLFAQNSSHTSTDRGGHMKKVFVLFGLLFAVCLAVCFIAPLPARAVAQTNQRAQPDTQVRVTHPRRRHRRRRIRRAAINTRNKVVDNSKTVAEKSQDVGENVVAKSKTVGRHGRRVGTRVGRRSKHVTNKVVDKTKDVVKPKQ